MKYEWRKQEKELYLAKKEPQLLKIPAQRFISLHGVGNPNGPDFAQKVQTLYPASYGIKAAYKKYCLGKKIQYDDYVVFPLEGVWSLTKKGQQMDHLDKNEFEYDLMMRVPDFVPTNLIDPTLQAIKTKKKLSLITRIELKQFPPMEVGQILHVGSYDTEPASFGKIDELVAANNRQRSSKIHREIYLSDARKVAADKLKTVLRYQIKK